VKRQFLIGGIILLCAILLAVVMVTMREDPAEKPPEEVAPLVAVEDIEIRSGALTVNGTGTVQAREEVTLTSELAGKLTYVNPDLRAGQFVRKGAVLFRIDTDDYKNAVQIARADVEAQRVAVLQAREEVALAKSELRRFEQRGGSDDPFASVDNSDYAARILPPDILTRQARGTENARTRNAAQASGLATRQPQLRSALAALQRARAQLVDAQDRLADTTVRAPFSGIVRSEDVALGSFVQPGQAIGSIVSSAAFEAVIPLSEQKAALIPGLFAGQRGGPIDAAVYSDYGGKRYRWQAYVDRVNSVLNPQTRTIDIFLRIPNPINGGALAVEQTSGQTPVSAAGAPPLLVGGFVTAEIAGIALESYAMLPVSALRPGNKVWLVENGKLRIVEVEIYQRSDDFAYISADQIGSNPVAVTGKLSVATEGMAVRVAKSGAKSLRGNVTQSERKTLQQAANDDDNRKTGAAQKPKTEAAR